MTVDQINSLQKYSKFHLITGNFLFLKENDYPSNTPVEYEIFKEFLIKCKNFNPNNEDRILELYEKYSNICSSLSFIDHPSFWKKSAFDIIEPLPRSMWNTLYFLSRGYSEQESKVLVTSVSNHTYKKEKSWEIFIDSIPKNRNIKNHPRSEKINPRTKLPYTKEELDERLFSKRLEACKSHKLKIDFNFRPLYKLFFEESGSLLTSPRNIKDFAIILEDVNVNPNNSEFIESLYKKYLLLFENYNFLRGENFKKIIGYSNLFDLKYNENNNQSNISIDFWLIRGWSKDEAIQKIKIIQSEKSLSKENAIQKYGEEGFKRFESYLEKRKTSINKKRESNPEYGKMYSKTINPKTGEYYTGEDLKEKIRENAKKALLIGSLSNAKNIKEGKTKTVWQKEYWLNKGYSMEEAVEKIISLMPKSNIEWFIQKYGEEEGTRKYQARIEKYKKTMESKSDEEKLEIIKKRAKAPHKISKASIKFFNHLLSLLSEEGIVFEKYYMGSDEYYIYDHEKTTIYFYDFCIPFIKVIIEFNGCMYHPLPSLSDEELEKWKSLFYKIPGKTQRDRDLRKESLAKEMGFSYLIIWDNDNIEESYSKAISFIKSNLNKNSLIK